MPLTPEGTGADEAVAAIDRLVADRVPVLSLSFHSPSLEPGHTPYVRDAADLRTFWRWWDAVFDRLAQHGVSGRERGGRADGGPVGAGSRSSGLSALRRVGYRATARACSSTVEQAAHNGQVGGSNPSGPTIIRKVP